MHSDIVNTYQNKAPSHIINAVKQASDKTGVDFSYLMKKAATESSFNPDIKAKTSSATGLYQFIDKTWISMIKKHGEKYGLSEQVKKIDNNLKVNDKLAKEQILNLRKDPKTSAFMAAEFAKENKAYIEKHLNRKANSTDLYMAHFLGAGGAAKFLQELQSNPNKDANDLLPKAAKANKPVFYDKTNNNNARSVKEVYAMFSKKFGIKNNTDATINDKITVAQNTIKPSVEPVKIQEEITDIKNNSTRQHYGRIPQTNTVTAGRVLSSENIFAMSDMSSVLYDLYNSDNRKEDKNEQYDNLYYPTPGFTA